MRAAGIEPNSITLSTHFLALSSSILAYHDHTDENKANKALKKHDQKDLSASLNSLVAVWMDLMKMDIASPPSPSSFSLSPPDSPLTSPSASSFNDGTGRLLRCLTLQPRAQRVTAHTVFDTYLTARHHLMSRDPSNEVAARISERIAFNGMLGFLVEARLVEETWNLFHLMRSGATYTAASSHSSTSSTQHPPMPPLPLPDGVSYMQVIRALLIEEHTFSSHAEPAITSADVSDKPLKPITILQMYAAPSGAKKPLPSAEQRLAAALNLWQEAYQMAKYHHFASQPGVKMGPRSSSLPPSNLSSLPSAMFTVAVHLFGRLGLFSAALTVIRTDMKLLNVHSNVMHERALITIALHDKQYEYVMKRAPKFIAGFSKIKEEIYQQTQETTAIVESKPTAAITHPIVALTSAQSTSLFLDAYISALCGSGNVMDALSLLRLGLHSERIRMRVQLPTLAMFVESLDAIKESELAEAMGTTTGRRSKLNHATTIKQIRTTADQITYQVLAAFIRPPVSTTSSSAPEPFIDASDLGGGYNRVRAMMFFLLRCGRQNFVRSMLGSSQAPTLTPVSSDPSSSDSESELVDAHSLARLLWDGELRLRSPNEGGAAIIQRQLNDEYQLNATLIKPMHPSTAADASPSTAPLYHIVHVPSTSLHEWLRKNLSDVERKLPSLHRYW